jgi:lipid A oxidase
MARSFAPLAALLLFVACPVGAAHAEIQLSVYGGGSISLDSDVKLKEAGTSTTFKNINWDGANTEMPPHWGARATWWFDSHPNWGVALDYTHAKVKADPLPPGFDRLEFTNGLNIFTLNALYRHPTGTRFTPYGGLGIGASVPHVEVNTANSVTYEYQLAGIAAQGLAGIDFRIWRGLSVFGEYKLSYTSNDVDLNGGGSLSTDIWTNHFNLGLAYKF